MAALAVSGLAIYAIALGACGGGSGSSASSPTPTYNILPLGLPTSSFSPSIRENKMSREEAFESAETWMFEKGMETFCFGANLAEPAESCEVGVRCDLSLYNGQLHIWLFTCATGIGPLRPGSVLVHEVKVSDDTGFASGI